jgi:hypothetical protein
VTRQPVVQVLGAKELRRSLKAAGDDLGDLKALNQAIGNMVVGVARGLAPTRTGRLAASLRANRVVGGVSVRAGSAAVPYAGPIHWGWPARNIKANTFILTAAQTSEAEWTALYEAEVNKILDKVEGTKSL